MGKLLTVFTPTYNRAYCLHQVYDSLCRQTDQNFEWLIIDDGSTDDTRKLAGSWIAEGRIGITYHYKENGGMHTGHNAAYALIKTEFNVCIDSDDYMPDNAVAIIIAGLKGLDQSYAGLVGLDADKHGAIIGTRIPAHLQQCKLNELYLKEGVTGDKKMVYRTAVMNQYPEYPVFAGEKFVPLDYKPLLIDQDYFLKPVNEVFCIVDYQPDGSTLNIFKQYRRNPRGFAFSRLSRIKYGKIIKERFKNAVHLVSCALFLGDFKLIREAGAPLLMLAAFIPGIILNIFIRFKTS